METLPTTRQTSREVNFIARAYQLTKIEEYTLLAIASTCAWSGKLYCWIKLETIHERVNKWSHYPVSMRTIDRAIFGLRTKGIISRKLRTTRDDQGKKIFTSSLTFLLAKAKYLVGKLIKLPRALGRLYSSPCMANYPSTKEKYLSGGNLKSTPPLKIPDEKGTNAPSISSKDLPQHILPEETKALWRKLGLVEG